MLSIIVAVAENGVIGKKGGLPWYLPAELAYFKKRTMGHPIIMGRKTHESIGRALPGRTNIIITHDKKYQAEGCIVVSSFEEALKQAKQAEGGDGTIVIGGESVYAMALPKADRLYLTQVKAKIKGDTFFKYDPTGWQETWSEEHKHDSKNPYDYRFTIQERAS